MAKRLIGSGVILGMMLAACGGGIKTFTAAQLGSFVLKQSDVPQGLQILPDASGPQTLDQVVSSDEEKTKLAALDFVAAHQASFLNVSAANLFSARNGVTADAEVISSLVAVFKTADEAHQALQFEHQRDLVKGKNMQTISVPKLGEETVGESGIPEDLPFAGYIIYWRIGNALFAVIVAGKPLALHVSVDEAKTFAKIMNDRANK